MHVTHYNLSCNIGKQTSNILLLMKLYLKVLKTITESSNIYQIILLRLSEIIFNPDKNYSLHMIKHLCFHIQKTKLNRKIVGYSVSKMIGRGIRIIYFT